MLLSESFVLLALDPEGLPARGVSNQPAAAIGVTGALLTELVQNGHLELDEGRIHLTGTRPSDPQLATTLDEVSRFEGKKLKSHLASIKHSGWSEIVDRMISSGILGREKHALRITRHPINDRALQESLLAEIRAAATGSGPLEGTTATLLALAGPAQLLEVVAPERSDRKHAKKRISEAAEQVPAAGAVKYVIEAAVVAAAMAGAVAAASVSGS